MVLLYLGLGATMSSGSLKTSDTQLSHAKEMNLVLRQTAIPELGSGRLDRIINRYYQKCLGGADNWQQIKSLKIYGNLITKKGKFGFYACHKKPQSTKISINNGQNTMTLCSNGEQEWQVMPGYDAKLMPNNEARRFRHASIFGNYLLYPYADGKTMEYIDTLKVEGKLCYQIQVRLKTNFQIDYFIDVYTYKETKAIHTDLTDGSTTSTVFTDHKDFYGVPFAMRADNYENGEWSGTLIVDRVLTNTGITSWFFKMPN